MTEPAKTEDHRTMPAPLASPEAAAGEGLPKVVGRVALVSYFFPPTGGAGTQRAAKLARYLPDSGWTSTVFCADSGSSVSQWTPEDESLLANIDERTEVVRSPGVGEAWTDRVGDAIEALVESGEIDAVLVTMSPFWLAPLIERLGPRVPIIADLRDPWALDGVPIYRHWFQWRQDLRRMGRTLEAAHAVVMNTPEARDVVLRTFRTLSPERVRAIGNGFDAEDFRTAEPKPRPEGTSFMLVHTGTFLTRQAIRPPTLVARMKSRVHYRPEPLQPMGRSVGPLLRAMELLRRDKPDLLDGFRFVNVGTLDDDTRRWIDESSVSDIVVATGYVPHAEAIGWLMGADALFLHLHGLPAGHRARIVPGKAYEYLASGRPILGAVPAGDAFDLVQSRARGVVADPCDASSIAAGLERLILSKGALVEPALSDPDLTRFDRREIASRFAELLSACVREGAR